MRRFLIAIMFLAAMPAAAAKHAHIVVRIEPHITLGAGSEVLFTIENRGAAAANVVLTRAIEGAPVTQWTCGLYGVDTCKFAILPPRTRIVTSATVAGVDESTHLVIRADATTTTPLDAPADAHASLDLRIADGANLAIESIAFPDAVSAEGLAPLRYTLRNKGRRDAREVRLRLQHNAGTLVDSADGAVTCAADARAPGAFDCALPDVAAGLRASFTIFLRPSKPQGHFNGSSTLSWHDPPSFLSASTAYEATFYRMIDVTATEDGGPGSLRDAILEADRGDCPCQIRFRIAGPLPPSGWFTIAPRSPLPPLLPADVILMNGYTQSALTGYTNRRGPLIEISGANTNGDGLRIETAAGTSFESGAQVGGLAIDGFSGNGIAIDTTSPNSVVYNCFIGVDPTGEVRKPNGLYGIAGKVRLYMYDNVIGGNASGGISLTGKAFGGIIGNRIGVSPSGADIGNGGSGVDVGPGTGGVFLQDNTIAHNGGPGIAIDKTSQNLIVDVNSLYDNGGAAIDIGLDGPTPNVEGFAAAPAVVDPHYDSAAGETVIGIHSSEVAPPKTILVLRVLVFATPALNRAGLAEAKQFLGAVEMTGADGVLRVRGDLRGQYITALADRELEVLFLNTFYSSSELSPGVQVR